MPKLFRQTIPQCWPGGDKTAVTELVARSLDQARLIVSRPQRTAASGDNQVVVGVSCDDDVYCCG